MKQSRLDALADGIFAIVMTILVFEIRVPELSDMAGNREIILGIVHALPLFLAYLLSFAVLFTYWRAHHFIASVYAKNIDLKLTNISAIFFFFVALVPFSSHLLGLYSDTQTAIIFFSINTIAIGLSLYEMRLYIKRSETIENEDVTPLEDRHAYTRILFPVFCALVASVLSFWSTTSALTLLTFGVLFNLLPKATTHFYRFLGSKE
jgi:uncharacterized membrane protein